MNNEYEQYEGARSKQRAKRRKTNLVLNSLIVIVVTLIVLVAYTIFSGGDKDKNEHVKQDTETNVTESSTSDKHVDVSGDKQTNSDDEQITLTDDQKETDIDKENKAVVVEEGTNPNVKRTLINPAWKPIGTEQTGEHVTVFKKDSLDWKEMEQAMAYAAEIPQDNMITWFISNGGPNKAIGTVTPKDGDQAYRIYIEWVDGQGWKPTKVEELIENDKGKSSIE